MDSTTLNERMREVADDGDFEAFGGKAVPYIGWYWRDVDFDADHCYLGVIPSGADGNYKPLVGFMENNKWGYDGFRVDGKAWTEIRALAEKVADDPTRENLAAFHERIQASR